MSTVLRLKDGRGVDRSIALIVVLALLLLLLLLPGSVAGQQTGTVTGQVVGADNLNPLSGVQMVVEGTQLGGITNNSGRYIILNVPAGQITVTATLLGRRSVQQTANLSAGETATLDFRLAETAISLDEIVVTGTAGAQQARALGTTVGSIQVSERQALAPEATFENMLTGSVAGVNVAQGGGAVGGGSNIRVRGAGSLVLSGQPLVYIDGVRVNAGGPGEDVTIGTGNSRPSSIITKRGAEGAPMFTLTTKAGQNWYMDPKTHWPGSYYTCFGTGTDPCTPGEIVYVNVFQRDFDVHGMNHFRNGLPLGTSGTVSGGTGELRYHFSAGFDRDEGPVPNNYQDRMDARANLNWLPRQDLTVDFGFGSMRSELHTTTGRQPARITGFHWSCPGGSNGCEIGTGLPNALDGPFRGYIAYLPDLYDELLDGGEKVARNTYSLTTTHRPSDWFTHRLVVGLDQVNTQGFRINRHSNGRVGISARQGARNVQFRNSNNYSFDYSTTATFEPFSGIESATSYGVQYYEKSAEWLSGSGSNFAVPSLQTISAGEDRDTSDGITGNKTIGMYLQEQISWQNRVFLTGAVRGDDNSAFGAEYDFVLYPKLSASWVVSESSFFEGVDFVNSLRLRAAWGKAGQQPDQFAAVRLYSPVPGFGGEGGVTPSTIGNPDVEPEVGEEFEAGFDAGLFDDRLGLEVTYYNQKRTNALINIPVKPSTGFPGSQLRNIGTIQNQGLEIGLNWEALNTPTLGLAFNTSVHFNKNEVLDLGGLDPIPVFGQNASTGWTGQRHVEGFPLGSVFLPRVVSADIEGTGLAARATNVMCESGPIAWPGTRITRGGGPAVPCTSSATAPEVYR
ncbi:MAG: TonB-dependent receptor, partial [Thioalkalivibrio sp.]|nr:TonB-dependent receptor [Thioalkalivibrio sp.]